MFRQNATLFWNKRGQNDQQFIVCLCIVVIVWLNGITAAAAVCISSFVWATFPAEKRNLCEFQLKLLIESSVEW